MKTVTLPPGLLAALLALVVLPSSGETSIPYALSTSPSEALITVRTGGGDVIPATTTTTVLFGDGRLVRSQQSAVPPSANAQPEVQVTLAAAEVSEIFRGIVDGGLVDLSWDDLKRQLESETGNMTRLRHPGWISIEIQIAEFGLSRRRVHSVFECRCTPSYLSHVYPESAELAAMSNLLRSFDRHIAGSEETP